MILLNLIDTNMIKFILSKIIYINNKYIYSFSNNLYVLKYKNFHIPFLLQNFSK
jgi:hypothetical protein